MELAHGKNIPRVKTPRRGPPRIPKMLKAACRSKKRARVFPVDLLFFLTNHTSRTLPSWAATNTKPKHKAPKPSAINLEMLVARASSISLPQKGRTKSSKQIAANEFKPLDTVLYVRNVNWLTRKFRNN